MRLSGSGLCVVLLLCPALSLERRSTAFERAIEFTPLPELSTESLPSLEYEASPADGYYLLPRSFVDGVLPGPLPYGQLSKLLRWLVHLQMVASIALRPFIPDIIIESITYLLCGSNCAANITGSGEADSAPRTLPLVGLTLTRIAN